MPNIHHELFIAATAEKVYAALTSQAGLSAWWTPDTKANAKTHSVSRFSFGADYFKEMEITALKPLQYVEWLCVAGAAEWIGTSISFTIEPGTKDSILMAHPEIKDQLQQSNMQNNGTVLTLRHNNWRNDTPMLAECNYTWGQFLGSLKLFCESDRGKPWPTQHQDQY
jgi:uncharacterized protein YndB with AHSA1/START domain